MHDNSLVYFILFGTFIVLLLIAAIVMSIILAQRQRARQDLLFTKANLEYESELRTIESEAQEATFSNIAAELHDNIGQLLAVVHMQLEKEKLQHSDIAHLFMPAGETLTTVIEQVRLLSHSLSSDLIGEGLQCSIDQEVQRLHGIGRLAIHYHTDGEEPDLSKDARTVAFRIFQEAVSNALRHADALNLYISLKGSPFLLQVRDDGKGFDKEAALDSSHGLGLKSMLRRASIAGLQCDIVSAEAKGSQLTLTLPEKVQGLPNS